MHCTHCGGRLSQTDRFCGDCGTPARAGSERREPIVESSPFAAKNGPSSGAPHRERGAGCFIGGCLVAATLLAVTCVLGLAAAWLLGFTPPADSFFDAQPWERETSELRPWDIPYPQPAPTDPMNQEITIRPFDAPPADTADDQPPAESDIESYIPLPPGIEGPPPVSPPDEPPFRDVPSACECRSF